MMATDLNGAEDDFTDGFPRPVAAELVIARRVLLDALEALGPHRPSLILAGAQAVYLTVGEQAGFGAQPTTTDGDLVIDARGLADEPHLDELMEAAGFTLQVDAEGRPIRPGVWGKLVPGQDEPVPIDLIVPRALSPAGRRAARIPPHARMAAMATKGLEVALVDRVRRTIAALEANDPREAAIDVAGPAALAVAKAFKIQERAEEADARRLLPKDGLDVVRLYQATTPATMAILFREALEDPTVGPVADEGLTYLGELFSRPDSVGTRLAVEATRGVIDPDLVREVCTSFTQQIVELLGR